MKEPSRVALKEVAQEVVVSFSLVAIGRELAAGRVPEAVICSNDEVAFGAMWAIHEHGLRVPHDVALVGFDGIALSGYGAVPQFRILKPKLLVRQSCGAHLKQRLI